MQREKNKWTTQHIGLIHFRNEGLAHIQGKRTAPQPFQSELLVEPINHTQNNEHVRYFPAQPIIPFINETQLITTTMSEYSDAATGALVEFTLEHFPNSTVSLHLWPSCHPLFS